MGGWKLPPKTKIYEALTAMADGRVKLKEGQTAEVVSSDGTKQGLGAETVPDRFYPIFECLPMILEDSLSTRSEQPSEPCLYPF